MLDTTLQIIKSGLKGDPTLSPRDRARIIASVRIVPETPTPEAATESAARLLRRAEAAKRLSCSLRTVDKLGATGILRKRKLPGRVRASGFLESDVEALITAGPGTAVAGGSEKAGAA
jgi:predicted DNA-binding transcriptional regulator AlpA